MTHSATEPALELDSMLDQMRAELSAKAAKTGAGGKEAGLLRSDIETYFDTVVPRHVRTLAFKYIAAVGHHKAELQCADEDLVSLADQIRELSQELVWRVEEHNRPMRVA